MTKSDRDKDASSCEQNIEKTAVDEVEDNSSRTGEESGPAVNGKSAMEETVVKEKASSVKHNESLAPDATKNDVKEEMGDEHAEESKEEIVAKDSAIIEEEAEDLDDDEPPPIKVNDPKRAAIEAPVNPIRNPNPHDVLLGRGKPVSGLSHEASLRTRRLLDSRQSFFSSCVKFRRAAKFWPLTLCSSAFFIFIIFRSYRKFQNHSGNQQMLNIVDVYRLK
jgi:hypothetical protein